MLVDVVHDFCPALFGRQRDAVMHGLRRSDALRYRFHRASERRLCVREREKRRARYHGGGNQAPAENERQHSATRGDAPGVGGIRKRGNAGNKRIARRGRGVQIAQ